MADENNGFRWSRKEASGWRIGYGPSNWLVAEGSGYSIHVGREMFRLCVEGKFDDEVTLKSGAYAG